MAFRKPLVPLVAIIKDWRHEQDDEQVEADREEASWQAMLEEDAEYMRRQREELEEEDRRYADRLAEEVLFGHGYDDAFDPPPPSCRVCCGRSDIACSDPSCSNYLYEPDYDLIED